MLPADRGDNFILKLDTSSLPTGYRLTTENPRVVRLTPGKMSEINFGASISQLIRIDLNPQAFSIAPSGEIQISDPLRQGLSNLVQRFSGEAVHIRISWHIAAEATSADVREGRVHMRLVQRHLEETWGRVGRTKLTLEQTIVRPDQ